MQIETSLYRNEHDVLKLAIWYYALDPPNAGWWQRTFQCPYKLVYVGDVTIDESNAPRNDTT